MRTIRTAALLFCVLLPWIPTLSNASVNNQSVSYARTPGARSFGLGIMLGDPTGLSAKYWTARSTALAFGLATSWHDYFEFIVDHEWHFPSAFRAGAPFVPYIGIGAGLFVDTYDPYYGRGYDQRRNVFRGYTTSSIALAVRVPLGIEFLPRSVPLGVFAEVVPAIGVFPGFVGFVQAALGGRFYF